MKQQYITPEIQIVTFDTEDVITTSNGTPKWNDSNTPGGEGWG